MIGSIRGTLIERDPRGVVIVECAGVGYEVNVTVPTAAIVGDTGSEVTLRIFTRVREESIALYGFLTGEEKRCFEALIAAHGVGPSMALALMSMHSPQQLRQIVALDDAASLSLVPGVGKKTATRLLLELKAKFDVNLDDEFVDITVSSASSPADSARADVVAALSNLGYGGDEIRTVLNPLPTDGDAGELLRLALRELARSS